jgi:hypothetical protein
MRLLRSLRPGNSTAAANQLRAFLNEIAAMIRSGRLSEADAAALQAFATRAIESISE